MRKSIYPLLSRHVGRTPRWLLRLPIFLLSGLLAFLLRFEFVIPRHQVTHLFTALAIWTVVKAIVFGALRLDRTAWRHVGVSDLARLASGDALASAIAVLPITLVCGTNFPRSVYVIDFVFCVALTSAARIGARLAADSARLRSNEAAAPVLIYGAGSAGILLVDELLSDICIRYRPIGFIDDAVEKTGLVLRGLRVLGTGADLKRLVNEFQIAEVLIAIPSATASSMAQILENCRHAGVRRRTMPSIAEVLQGTSAAAVRDIALEDLLGRPPVRLDAEQIRRGIEGQVVLVTGAAGSIGSELCRQIARFKPRRLVAFENSETALFFLDREMLRGSQGTDFVAEIGSVQNRARFREVLEQHRPSVVYHAAAYKHVPLMETNVVEAVENNILGTYKAVAASAECGVRRFVMISSDKAVRPANIMGATKRVAELIVKSFQPRISTVSVRFGNVLGSNGSVIPIFREQIAAGGPLEVTHPDVKRYFMTIPEAAQLVLQASTMGKGGEIFVLDMGQPVLITELARSLVELSGLRPDKDIQIVYTGLRPGEKLFEELNTLEEETGPSPHEKIKVFCGTGMPLTVIMRHLVDIERLVEQRDRRGLVFKLQEIVPDYTPGVHAIRDTASATSAAGRQSSASLSNLAHSIRKLEPALYSQFGTGHSQNPKRAHGQSDDELIREGIE